VQRSHARLLATVDGLDDATARRPSLLPGWDVAMVVTHLARNADGHANVAEGAARGEVRRRYPSPQARDDGIEAGRGRGAAQVGDDLHAAVARLEAAWASLPAAAWSTVGRSATDEPEPLADAPRYRWRETEVHHVDLGLGFTVDDWDAAFVARELAEWVPGLPHRLAGGGGVEVVATDTGDTWRLGPPEAATRIDAPSRHLLAWLTGRRTEGLPAIGPWDW
jgi:maleylpyruvate isomerase